MTLKGRIGHLERATLTGVKSRLGLIIEVYDALTPKPRLSRLMRHAPAFGLLIAVDRKAGETETALRARFAGERAT
jgi:hypothetical protein